MSRPGILLKSTLVPAGLALALALAGCGSQRAAATRATAAATMASVPKTQTLYIYSGLPHNGPQAAATHQIEQGIEFALSQVHRRIRSDGITYHIVYRPLSDSTPQQSSRSRTAGKKVALTPSRGWNQRATIRSAEEAALNPHTVAYIGNLDSGATALSLPILNQAGIVQLTPGSGYPGLTESVPGVTPSGEPNIYYPQVRPSLLRLVPNDLVQAAAAVYWLKSKTTCHRLAAAAFGGDPDAEAMVLAVKAAAKRYALGFESARSPGTDTKTYAAYVSALAQHQVNCMLLAGRVTKAAVAFTTAFHTALPGAVILGTNGLCNRRWSDHTLGGVPPAVDPYLYCTTPVLPLSTYPGGAHFAATFHRSSHRRATAYTFYGYMGGSLVAQAIRLIGAPDSRKQVMTNLVSNAASAQLPFAYTFDSDGDPTGTVPTEYGLDRVNSHGIPEHFRVLSQ